MFHELFALTNDYASDGASLLDVSGLFCEHALSALKQSDVAPDILSIADFRAAAVRFSHGDEASYLHTGGKIRSTDEMLQEITEQVLSISLSST